MICSPIPLKDAIAAKNHHLKAKQTVNSYLLLSFWPRWSPSVPGGGRPPKAFIYAVFIGVVRVVRVDSEPTHMCAHARVYRESILKTYLMIWKVPGPPGPPIAKPLFMRGCLAYPHPDHHGTPWDSCSDLFFTHIGDK